MAIVEVRNLNKRYKEKVLFDNFNLKIDKGEFVIISGESGSGKSTLLNMIGGLEKIDNGEILINNNIKKDLRFDISFIFQNFALIENKTVEYNLLIGLEYVKISKKEKLELISKTLKDVGLENQQKSYIYSLSGGEQQRIAIARIILKPSKLILADEPTGSLDTKNKWEIMNLLKQLNDNGKTIIMVTHDKELFETVDRVIQI